MVTMRLATPIWIAAISTEESFLYAAQNGFHLMIVPYAGKPGLLQELGGVRADELEWAGIHEVDGRVRLSDLLAFLQS